MIEHLNSLTLAMKITDIINPHCPRCFDSPVLSVFPSNRDILSHVEFLLSTTGRKKAVVISDVADTISTWENAARKDNILK